MKTTLVTLLAAVLCVEQAYPFMCYVCQEQESNKNCLTISICAEKDKYCVTVRNNIGTKPNKPKYVISKMCSPTCPATSQQQNQTSRSVSCCEKPLCNVNGVSSKQSRYGVMSLGVLTAIAYIFACGL
ncbi:PREDICTED: lymphocyte antigen 6E-like [Charadrius vociferus]|uniref:lymphocyte antigen 6E-like n=1 Tax=Charadrius vociferus TaxID=50402 RepID=UPI0005219811|nr:PREDICTED: lymphocyte antigen 6E-like [Charadrius vociferus]